MKSTPSVTTISSQKGVNCALRSVTSVLDTVKKVISGISAIFCQNGGANILGKKHSF